MPNWSPANFTGSGGQTAGDAALTPHVRAHMVRVYNLLALGVASAAVGSMAMMLTPLGKTIPYWLPMFGGFVPLIWLMWAPPASIQARLALFFAFTTLEGMTLAPLIKLTLAKGVLGSALVLTGAVFLGFSAAALAAPRASMLALQGPLFGMLLGMVAISILNIFYPTAFAHSIVLYGGLAIFSLFVAVDTQAMIERAACGNSDHVGDALQMFLNVVNIFVRIAAILRGE
jgi:FtsH-binding integral membrane protein